MGGDRDWRTLAWYMQDWGVKLAPGDTLMRMSHKEVWFWESLKRVTKPQRPTPIRQMGTGSTQ